jgi:hypothetical protein
VNCDGFPDTAVCCCKHLIIIRRIVNRECEIGDTAAAEIFCFKNEGVMVQFMNV